MTRSFDIRAYEEQLRKGMEKKFDDVVRAMLPSTMHVRATTLCCGDAAKGIDRQ